MRFRASLLAAVGVFVTFALVIGSGPMLQGQAARGKAALLNPADLKEQAPAAFKVNFDTSAGPFVVEVHRDWGPTGADHFYNLVKRGFYDGTRFFRVVPGFLAQFGISGDPEITKVWLNARINDDPRGKQSNKKGFMAYVNAGLNRRSTQVFINLADNPLLDSEIVPFGQVISGMNVVEKLYADYGDSPPTGQGPDRNRYYAEGTPYLEKEFPRMDYIKTATIVP